MHKYFLKNKKELIMMLVKYTEFQASSPPLLYLDQNEEMHKSGGGTPAWFLVLLEKGKY